MHACSEVHASLFTKHAIVFSQQPPPFMHLSHVALSKPRPALPRQVFAFDELGLLVPLSPGVLVPFPSPFSASAGAGWLDEQAKAVAAARKESVTKSRAVRIAAKKKHDACLRSHHVRCVS